MKKVPHMLPHVDCKFVGLALQIFSTTPFSLYSPFPVTPKKGFTCSKITNWRVVVGAKRAQTGKNPAYKPVGPFFFTICAIDRTKELSELRDKHKKRLTNAVNEPFIQTRTLSRLIHKLGSDHIKGGDGNGHKEACSECC